MKLIKQKPISVVIITKNAAKTLAETLSSVQDFSEVLVYDNGSTDSTCNIASQFSNVKLITGTFTGFGPTKRAAVNLAMHDWILSLDADETVSTALIAELEQLPLKQPLEAYLILRQNLFMGRHVNYAGWQNDWLLRFFNRQHHQFCDKPVHEEVLTTAETTLTKLKASIVHSAVTEISQFLVKIDRYSELKRQEKETAKPIPIILLKTVSAFIKSYFLKKGCLAGWRGFVIAWSNANGVFYKYIKVYADQQTN